MLKSLKEIGKSEFSRRVGCQQVTESEQEETKEIEAILRKQDLLNHKAVAVAAFAS